MLFIAIYLVYVFDPWFPTKRTEVEWQKSFSEALIPGYTEFDGHWLDIDIAAYIFSYKYPETVEVRNAIMSLGGKMVNFTLYETNNSEIAFRSPYKTNWFSRGFEEYRFIYNAKNRRVYVLFASISSEVENQAHESLAEKLRNYSREK